jgi:hypothetical protein
LNANCPGPVSGPVDHDSADRCRLGTVREHGMRNECVRSHSLQAHFVIAVANNPNDAELSFDLTHLDIEKFTGSNLSHYTLNYQATHAQVDYESVMGKRLAMSIHSPNLYRELNFDSRAEPSIHGRHCAP